MNRLSLSFFLLSFIVLFAPIANGQKVLNLASGEYKIFEKITFSIDRTWVEIFIEKESYVYNANEIDFIKIDNQQKYVSKKIVINNKHDYYLLRQIEEGKVNFFAFKDKVFFIQSTNKPLEKLYYTRENIKVAMVDTMYRFLQEEGSFLVNSKYLTIIQNHLGPSITVSNNLKLREASIKKVIRRLNLNFPTNNPSSFFTPLVAKRLYVGGVGIRNNLTNESVIAPQIGYELGINYKGMLTTGYLNFMRNPSSDDASKNGIFRKIQANISFGVRQYILINSFIKPFIDLGIQNESMTLQSGLLLQKGNYLISGSINLKNDILGSSISNSSGIFQVNLGYQI
ncbi:MAG: hypothetical protein ACJATI_002108 [Halioglobus sp.]|jgi:hypothetical protein